MNSLTAKDTKEAKEKKSFNAKDAKAAKGQVISSNHKVAKSEDHAVKCERWEGRFVFVGIAVLLLGGCALDPIRLHDPETVVRGTTGVLFPIGVSRETQLFSRDNFARVTRIDGVDIPDTGSKIELLAGRHVVVIRHQRQTLFCLPYPGFGCLTETLASRTLTLTVEAGHIYRPYAMRYCETNWIWIANAGKVLMDDIKSISDFPSPGRILTNQVKLPVVAGVAPLMTCDVPRS